MFTYSPKTNPFAPTKRRDHTPVFFASLPTPIRSLPAYSYARTHLLGHHPTRGVERFPSSKNTYDLIPTDTYLANRSRDGCYIQTTSFMPVTWFIDSRSVSISGLENKLMDGGVAAWELLEHGIEPLLKVFKGGVEALIPHLPESYSERIVIDKYAFKSYVNLKFNSALAKAKALASKFLVQRQELLLGLIGVELYNPRATHLAWDQNRNYFQDWFPKRVEESDKWVGMLGWMEERMTIQGMLNLFAEEFRGFGEMDVYMRVGDSFREYRVDVGKVGAGGFRASPTSGRYVDG
jgi:hypothetical protein